MHPAVDNAPVGDLALDTAVTGGDGRYRALLSGDWEIWGPNGGYLAAVALRAAGAHTSLGVPASYLGHFLDVAAFAPVDLEVRTVRRSRRAESLRVSMTQEGRVVLEALVWAVAEGLDGLEHADAPAPPAPAPATVPSVDDRLAAAGGGQRVRFPFFDNLDERPLLWVDDWDRRPAAEPLHRSWYRFLPTGAFDDPWVDAGRLLIAVDTFQWPAAARGHAGGALRHVAPSLDLACRFHRLDVARRAEWLLVEARSPVAAGGLVGGVASVWDESATLLASGGQQMLARPDPGAPAA